MIMSSITSLNSLTVKVPELSLSAALNMLEISS
jgi:hypothetical protein